MIITLRRIRFDWQILVILAAAIFGLNVAFNVLGATVQFALILLGFALYLLLANLPDPVRWAAQTRSVLSGILSLLPFGISLYFLLTNDWSRWLGKLPLFDPVLRILAMNPLSSIGMSINPNAVGGTLAILLPLQVAALKHTRRWLALIAIAVSVTALILSLARGAWLALILTGAAWLVWRFLAARLTSRRHAVVLWLVLMFLGSLSAVVLFTATSLGEQLLDLGGDRRSIWGNSLNLIGDYPVTGMGLGAFELGYASYALLTHVGHTLHAHNLILDIWLGLGLGGVIAFMGMVLNAVWAGVSASAWRTPALMALAVMLIHGTVDDALWGYFSIMLPITFIPLALLARADDRQPSPARRAFQPALGLWSTVVVIGIVALATPTGRAMLQANFTALQQTRAELSVYRWPAVPLQDVLRQKNQGETAHLAERYRAVLELDPNNVTALWRLGQIGLAQEDFSEACGHLSTAYTAAPTHRAVRQLLGECLALRGAPAEAATLWHSIDVGQGQLTIRQWWYREYLHDDARAQALEVAIEAAVVPKP